MCPTRKAPEPRPGVQADPIALRIRELRRADVPERRRILRPEPANAKPEAGKNRRVVDAVVADGDGAVGVAAGVRRVGREDEEVGAFEAGAGVDDPILGYAAVRVLAELIDAVSKDARVRDDLNGEIGRAVEKFFGDSRQRGAQQYHQVGGAARFCRGRPA